MEHEWIDRAAVALGDEVFALPKPARHDNVLAIMLSLPMDKSRGF